MDSTVIVAIISFLGTFIGTAGGIITAGKLTQYRLEQLEKKVENFSQNISKISVVEEKVNGLNSRIKNIEKERNQSYGFFDAFQ